MKKPSPNRRIINKILGCYVHGWNDQRSDHNRIKLVKALSNTEERKLQMKLTEMFPDFRIEVERYVSTTWDRPVTVIRYREI